jgi:sporulation protein YlmC with PRC-barrel domain
LSVSPKKKVISGQKLFGMQVIDVKGSLVGTVKDVGVDTNEKQMVLFVTTKAMTDVELTWSSIQSIEDVVLLNKQVETPPAPAQAQPVSTPSAAPLTHVCPNCKFNAPVHAKFCPKCGSSIK